MKEHTVFEQVLCQFGNQPAFHATVSLTGHGLIISNHLNLNYFSIENISWGNYSLTLKMGEGVITLSELGYAFEEFMACLYGYYNDYLLCGYYIDEPLKYRCTGEYALAEHEAEAEIRLYPSSLCVLPTDAMPLRFPLCFIREVTHGRYDACITDDLGQSVYIKRLGYEQDAFALNLQRLRERQMADTLSRLRLLWGNTGLNLEAAAPLLEGNCAALGHIEKVCPGFSTMFDKFAAGLSIREEYAFFRHMSGNELAIGVLRNASPENPAIWLTVPMPGNMAAVEIAAADRPDAATYLYRAQDFGRFLSIVSHAMEAVDYRREPIKAPDDGKEDPPADEKLALALRLTPSLTVLRKCYAGRAIHKNLDSWKRAVLSRQ